MVITMSINTDSIEVPIYGIILVLGTMVGILTNTVLNCIEIEDDDRLGKAVYSTVLSLICTFCFGSIFTLVTSGFESFGFSSMGGLLGMYVAYIVAYVWIYNKTNKNTLFSNFVLVIPLMYGLTKLGCLMGSCCYGIEYSGVLSIEYSGEAAVSTGALGERFPVQLAESIVFIIIFIIHCKDRVISRKDKVNSSLNLCVQCAIAKFSLDFLRNSHIGQIISVNQVMCLVVIVMCAFAYCKRTKDLIHEKSENSTLE